MNFEVVQATVCNKQIVHVEKKQELNVIYAGDLKWLQKQKENYQYSFILKPLLFMNEIQSISIR